MSDFAILDVTDSKYFVNLYSAHSKKSQRWPWVFLGLGLGPKSLALNTKSLKTSLRYSGYIRGAHVLLLVHSHSENIVVDLVDSTDMNG